MTQSRFDDGAQEKQAHLGSALYSFTEKLDPALRVAVIISGDLSHVYKIPELNADLSLYTPDPK